jgi:hypothetical protein
MQNQPHYFSPNGDLEELVPDGMNNKIPRDTEYYWEWNRDRFPPKRIYFACATQ